MIKLEVTMRVAVDTDSSWLEVMGSPSEDLLNELRQYLYDIEGLSMESIEVREMDE